MKTIFKTFSLILMINLVSTLNYGADTVIKMEKINGVFYMPCSVNGIYMNFIYDTGASDVTISLTEALFMLKNGHLSSDDIVGTENYRIANGDIEEGTVINIKKIVIGNLILRDIQGSIVHELEAPLLLGQSVLERLGKIEFNYENETLTIKHKSNQMDDDQTIGIVSPDETKRYKKVNPGDAFNLRNQVRSSMDKVRFYRTEPKKRVKLPYYDKTRRRKESNKRD